MDPFGPSSITVTEAATCRRSGRNMKAIKCQIWKPSRNCQDAHIPGIGRGRDMAGGLRTGGIGAQRHGSRKQELDGAAVRKSSMDGWSMPQPFPLQDLVRAHWMLKKFVNGGQHIVQKECRRRNYKESQTPVHCGELPDLKTAVYLVMKWRRTLNRDRHNSIRGRRYFSAIDYDINPHQWATLVGRVNAHLPKCRARKLWNLNDVSHLTGGVQY